jgi:hypothetical protein
VSRVAALRTNVGVALYLVRNPREFRRLRRWLSERTAQPMALCLPWWPYDATTWVAEQLPPDARVFEYGGGGSTLWLQGQGATVTVAEHNLCWHARLREMLLPGTSVLLRRTEPSGTITSAVEQGYFDSYVAAISDEPDESMDLVVVDGRARVECVRHGLSKVKPGGLLLMDDTERPRYRLAADLLADWERHVFAGLKPGSPVPAQTSVWRRPG